MCVASPREGKQHGLRERAGGEGFQRSQGSRRLPGQNRPHCPGPCKAWAAGPPQLRESARASLLPGVEDEQNHPETGTLAGVEWGLQVTRGGAGC